MTALNASEKRRDLFGLRFSNLDTRGLLDEVTAPPRPGQGVVALFTTNVDHIVRLRSNPVLRRAYDFASYRTIDGMPLLVYANARKLDVPGRVTGADLVPELLARVTPGQHVLFFLCATEEIAVRLHQWGAERGFTEDALHTVVPPMGFERDENYSKDLAARIRAANTTHLLMGVGCPKSEIWLHRYRDSLGDLYGFAVGAALAFFTGLERRAPVWMRRSGGEWLWRVGQEPTRLAKRYFIDSWAFVAAMIDDMAGRPALAAPAVETVPPSPLDRE